jgi:hypothetical protein
MPPEIFHGPIFWSADDVAKIVFLSIAGLALVTWIVARSPIGLAIGEGLKKLFGVHAPAALPGELDELRRQVVELRQQLGELAERQDFSERMLAQVRREKALPGANDVQG